MLSLSSTVLVSAFLAVLALVVDCQSSNPAFVPSIAWMNVTELIPRRTYPACTYNIHAPANTVPLMWMLGGEFNYSNQVLENDVWYSTDGFLTDAHQIQPTPLSFLGAAYNTTFQHRRAGSAAYLYNGNLLWFGGKNDDPSSANSGQMNTVYSSTDRGFTWSQFVAPWTPRSDMAACVAPFTNVLFATGGQIPNGTDLNDVYLNTDGIGQVWNPQPSPPFAPLQSGACAFFYDSVLANSASTNPLATLMLLDNNGLFFQSTNYGQTWLNNNGSRGPWTSNPADSSFNFMNILVDRDNVVYVFSGQNDVNSAIYWSNNYGVTWYNITASNALGLASGAQFSYATTSCAAISLYQNAINGIFYKRLTIYGGSIWATDGNIYESMQGLMNIPVATSVPTITWTNPTTLLPRRTYPACTFNVHAPATALPLMFTLGGEVNYTNQILTNDVWYSTNAFLSDSHQIQPTPLSFLGAAYNTTFQHRRAGSAGILVNGNLLWFGGKNDDPSSSSGGQMNTVYLSTDLGNTWTQFVAPWTPRSDIAACVAPFTNVLYAAGGQIPTGADLNDVWLTSDGMGQVWTPQPSPPFAPLQSGACAFFYDSVLSNSSSTRAIATMMILDNNGQFFTTPDYGQTYSAATFGPWNTQSQSRNFMNLLIDRDNFVYAFSGQNYVDPNVYFSTNYGASWVALADVSFLSKSDGAYFSYATTSCAAIRLYQNGVNGIFYKAITVYGGSIWLSDNTIVEAIQGTTSLVANVNVPQVTWTLTQPYLLPRRTYPSCTYNVHTSANSLPIMFILGGELNYTNQVLENDVWYSTDGFFADSHVIQPTSLLNMPGTNFTHRRAGSAAFLANGNLLWWGGKNDDPANANSGQLNSVYYSTDLANTWSQVTATIPWTPRSDMAACVAPLTNTVFFAGGQIPSGANTAEMWISQDGIGAVWSQPSTSTPWAAFQSGVCAFFYDSNLVNPSAISGIATLMLIDDNGQVFISTNYGVTFSSTYGPWLVASQSRNFMNLLIDRDNYAYAFSGQNYGDPNIYLTTNKGASWVVLSDLSSLGFADQASFSYATTSCAGFLLTQGATAGTYRKTISIYGGSIWLTDNTIVESIHGQLSLTSAVSSYSYTPYIPAATTTATGYLCFLTYGLPGNIDYPWSSATSVSFTYNPALVSTPSGTAVTILSGTGTRTFLNRFGTSSSTSLTVNAGGLLYVGNSFPFDSTGVTWTLGSAIQMAGHGPSVLYSTINVYNASGVVTESHESRIDPLGQAYLSNVPGFVNSTIGASNINSLAPVYTTCSAPITFTNGLRAPTQPTASNGALRFLYMYSISDGVTYSVQGSLTITASSGFGNLFDQLGNPYQSVVSVTGTRTYTYIPTSQTVVSTISGLSTSAYPYADQRFYPYALLGAAPGVYTLNTAPFLDYDGIEFNISPSAPINGAAPGNGTQYNATSVYFTTPESTAVLTEVSSPTPHLLSPTSPITAPLVVPSLTSTAFPCLCW